MEKAQRSCKGLTMKLFFEKFIQKPTDEMMELVDKKDAVVGSFGEVNMKLNRVREEQLYVMDAVNSLDTAIKETMTALGELADNLTDHE